MIQKPKSSANTAARKGGIWLYTSSAALVCVAVGLVLQEGRPAASIDGSADHSPQIRKRSTRATAQGDSSSINALTAPAFSAGEAEHLASLSEALSIHGAQHAITLADEILSDNRISARHREELQLRKIAFLTMVNSTGEAQDLAHSLITENPDSDLARQLTIHMARIGVLCNSECCAGSE